jgi:GNAT superfamily N-acetyltransferase
MLSRYGAAGLAVYPGRVARDIRLITRPAVPADYEPVAALRAATWRAAYEGIIDRAILDRATAPGGPRAAPPPYRSMLVAVDDRDQAVIGFASHGPERRVATLDSSLTASSAGQPPGPAIPSQAELTPAGAAGLVGELYALYVTPDLWSAGVGRALLGAALTALRAAGYRRMVLWTLTDNARARRFYERAGLSPDGATNILAGLGGVEELRYACDL